MILSDEILNNFDNSKAIATNTQPLETEYNTDGTLLALTQPNILRLYSALTGEIQNIVHINNLQKLVFNYPNCVLHSSLNMIYYLSIYDNQYIRVFDGHKTNIKSISTSSIDDTFISASSESVNYWDIRCKDPVYKINAQNPLASVSNGNNFAITVSDTLVKIYDKRSTKGPLYTTEIPIKDYEEIYYSPDGEHFVISSDRSHMILDYQGKIKNTVNLERPNRGCITPDSKYFMCSSGEFVFVYRLSDRKKISTYKTPGHDNLAVRFNPKYAQFVASSDSINIWAVPE